MFTNCWVEKDYEIWDTMVFNFIFIFIITCSVVAVFTITTSSPFTDFLVVKIHGVKNVTTHNNQPTKKDVQEKKMTVSIQSKYIGIHTQNASVKI